MNQLYNIVGPDGQTYQNLGAAQIQAWIQQGHVSADTLAQAMGDPSWRKLCEYPDFAPWFQQAGPAQPIHQPVHQPVYGSTKTSVWKIALGAAVPVIAIIVWVAINLNSSSSEKLLKVHNTIDRLESQYVNSVKMAARGDDLDVDRIVKAADAFDHALLMLNLDGVPDEYQSKVSELRSALSDLRRAARADDLDDFTEANDRRLDATRSLNKICADQGLKIKR